MNEWSLFIGIVLAWFIPQLLKKFFNRGLSLKQSLYKTGGMPSSHSSTVAALSLLLLLETGLSTGFIISLVLAGIVIRDGFGVRYAEGQNAHLLKKIIKDKKLKDEVVIQDGHTFKEVFVGLCLGFVIAVFSFLVF